MCSISDKSALKRIISETNERICYCASHLVLVLSLPEIGRLLNSAAQWAGKRVNKYRLNRETFQLLHETLLLASFDDFFIQQKCQHSHDKQQIANSIKSRFSYQLPSLCSWRAWKMNPLQVLFYSSNRSPLKWLLFVAFLHQNCIRFSLMQTKGSSRKSVPTRWSSNIGWNSKIIKMPLRTQTTKRDVLGTFEGQFIT